MTHDIMKPLDFLTAYCDRQVNTIEGLTETLKGQMERFNPDGWMLLECEMLDSSRCGDFTILPYGPNNTHKEVPNRPISPRGLASDMSTVFGIMTREDFTKYIERR